MKIHAFIFSWGHHAAAARALQKELAPLAQAVTVISSEDGLAEPLPGWVAIGKDAYFSAQWNAALARFDGDLLFHIQADARPADLAALFARARQLFAAHALGILEPHVDFTDLTYDRQRLRAIAPGLFEIPVSDCTCWFVHGTVARRFPKFDLAVNRFGWGTCGVMAGLCRLENKLCGRDYTQTVAHPRSRGYSSPTAWAELAAYLESLPPELRRAAAMQYQEKARLTGAPPPATKRPPFWARWF